jgi:multidrug transporter EmrE-like cation transporter
MKTLALYSLAAIMYVSSGVFMKYSQGLTQALPTLGLTVLFSAGALIQARAMRYEELGTSYIMVLGLEALLAVTMGSLLFGEQISARAAAGIALALRRMTSARHTASWLVNTIQISIREIKRPKIDSKRFRSPTMF